MQAIVCKQPRSSTSSILRMCQGRMLKQRANLGRKASDTGTINQPSNMHEPGGVPRRHASELSYDDFVLQYMGPNLPVMIQVRASFAQRP